VCDVPFNENGDKPILLLDQSCGLASPTSSNFSSHSLYQLPIILQAFLTAHHKILQYHGKVNPQLSIGDFGKVSAINSKYAIRLKI
jgi:hypothetical protein